MKKEENKEKLEDVYQDLLTCKDFITALCSKPEDQPDLKVGFELGSIYMIILRALNDVSELKS